MTNIRVTFDTSIIKIGPTRKKKEAIGAPKRTNYKIELKTSKWRTYSTVCVILKFKTLTMWKLNILFGKIIKHCHIHQGLVDIRK